MKTNALSKMSAAIMAFAVAVLTLAVTPVMAHAESAVLTGGSLTVERVVEGDVVNVYKVVDTKVDQATNQVTNTFVDGLGNLPFTMEQYMSDSANVEQNANTIASAVFKDGSTIQAEQTVNVTSGQTTAKFSNLTSGQYLVVVSNSKDVSRVYQNMIVNVLPVVKNNTYVLEPATVSLKYAEVSLSKTVETKKSVDSFGTGSTMQFAITTTIPNYRGAADRTFRLTDTMTKGITFNESSLVVKAGDTVLNQGSDYVVDYPTDTTFRISITNTAQATYASRHLMVAYTGTVNDQAVYSAPETNTVDLDFSNNFFGNTVSTLTDKVYITVYGLTFTKVSAEDGTPLAGAEFEVKLGDTVVSKATSDENGKVVFNGAFGADITYTLHEVKAPAGYVLRSDIQFTPKSDVATDGSYAGKLILIGAGADGNVVIGDASHNTVINTKSAFGDLPATGGAGTIGLMILGIAIIAAGTAWLIRLRRKQS